MSLKDSSLSTRAPRWVCGRKKGSGCLFSKHPWERQGWLGTRESTSSPLNSPLLHSSTHTDESGPVDSKTSHFVSLNFFTSKLNFTQTGVSKASQCFLGPPGREPGWGPRMVQRRGRRELQLGKQSPHCSPCSISAAAQAGCLPQNAANELMAPPCSVYTGVFPPQGSSGFANMRDHMLPGDGCSHLQAAKGRNWGPQWGRGGFRAEQTQEGSQKGRQVLSPHWPLWLPGCLCLVKPALDRDKTFGFFTSRDCSSFPSTTRSWSWSPGTVWGGGWASDPQPHLFRQFCQQWQGSRGRGRSGAWKTLSHTWKMSPGPTNTHSTLFIHFSSPYSSISWKTNREAKGEIQPIHLFLPFFFFFQLPNFNCSQLQCPRFFTGYIVRNWKEWKNQRGKEIKKTYHILKNGQDQIVVSRQVKLVLKL